MASARVVGNVVAPRVSIETGARFEGSITTKEAQSVAARAAAPETPRAGSPETPRTGLPETPNFAKLGSGGR
jgi:cytoskeletal protein CcmA (bactofilin family)